MENEHTPLVLVRWTDATTYYGWYTVEEAKKFRPIEVETYGQLLHNDDEVIVIAPTISESVEGYYEDSCADPFTIPRSWCQEIHYLGLADV